MSDKADRAVFLDGKVLIEHLPLVKAIAKDEFLGPRLVITWAALEYINSERSARPDDERVVAAQNFLAKLYDNRYYLEKSSRPANGQAGLNAEGAVSLALEGPEIGLETWAQNEAQLWKKIVVVSCDWSLQSQCEELTYVAVTAVTKQKDTINDIKWHLLQ